MNYWNKPEAAHLRGNAPQLSPDPRGSHPCTANNPMKLPVILRGRLLVVQSSVVWKIWTHVSTFRRFQFHRLKTSSSHVSEAAGNGKRIFHADFDFVVAAPILLSRSLSGGVMVYKFQICISVFWEFTFPGKHGIRICFCLFIITQSPNSIMYELCIKYNERSLEKWCT